jgi:hypothetical protein
VPFYALWKSVLDTGHCVCIALHVWKFGFCPNSLKGTLLSTMVCTDDDVEKLHKIIHRFFSDEIFVSITQYDKEILIFFIN